MTGLADHLGFPDAVDTPLRGTMRTVFALPLLTPAVRSLAPHMDRAVLALTAGRTTATSALTGLPVLWVTTSSHDGVPHTVPLVPIPHGRDLAVIGSALGRRTVPRWARNLAARSDATVRWRDREEAAHARRPDEDEETRIWRAAIDRYRGFEGYRVRAGGRPIPVFVLEPA